MPRTTPSTYSEAADQTSSLLTEFAAATKQFERGSAMQDEALSKLQSLGNPNASDGFLNTVQYVRAEADKAENVADPAWQNLRAKIDKIVTDYQSKTSQMQTKITARNGS